MTLVLTVAAFVGALGFGTFVLGGIFNLRGVAVIGAVVVVGLGVMMTTQGLAYADGQTVEEISNNTTVKTTSYQDVELPNRLPLGFLTMLTGGVLVLRGFGIEMRD